MKMGDTPVPVTPVIVFYKSNVIAYCVNELLLNGVRQSIYTKCQNILTVLLVMPLLLLSLLNPISATITSTVYEVICLCCLLFIYIHIWQV